MLPGERGKAGEGPVERRGFGIPCSGRRCKIEVRGTANGPLTRSL